jgi:hypothetical protein
MTAHIINAAVYIRVMRGRKAEVHTLSSRDLDFDTAYCILAYPDLHRRRERRQHQR